MLPDEATDSKIPDPIVEAPKESTEEAIKRLAKLPPLDYEKVRKTEAATLGIERIAVLDSEVKTARGGKAEVGAGHPLMFPEVSPWPEPVDFSAVLAEIACLCLRFLQLPKHGDTVVALWVALTYATEAFDCLPLLFITAPEKGCGKSTVLDLVQRLCWRPLPASNITAAALFRTVELAQPTLLLDEADSFLRDNEEMRGIINSGHTRSAAYVVRLVGDDHEPRMFSTWCPKAIAGIGRLPGTIEDRALIVTMQRLAPGEHVEKLRRHHQWPDIHRKLLRWSGDSLEWLKSVRPVLPDNLHNRTGDNWEPLFAIAEAAGYMWSTRVSEAAAELTGGEVAHSVGTELLRDIRAAFRREGKDKISTNDLIAHLVADDAGLWADYDRGKPITGPQIAKLLKRYSIRPKTVRIGGPVKGYAEDQFIDAFSRYLPSNNASRGNSAVTRLQPNKDKAPSDFSDGYTTESVTAASSAQVSENTTVLPRNRSEVENLAGSTKWSAEL